MSRAGLWAWFLFESGLGAQRAKELLSTWQSKSWSLKAALERAATEPGALGLTPAEARTLSPPGLPPIVDALLWDDTLYPAGLNQLPIRLRPALLFYRGDPALLMRPIVYLPPAELLSEDVEPLREIINLLVGEALLFAVFDQSAQSAILLEELAYGQGEALLFAAAGLAARESPGLEAQLIGENRLLVISPLPPNTPHRPAISAVLEQVAAAAADRLILSGAAARNPGDVLGLRETPALALADAASGGTAPPNVQFAEAGSGALSWMGMAAPASETAESISDATAWRTVNSQSTTAQRASSKEAYDLPEDDPGPPPSPEEILATLRQGGTVPEALRKRLVNHDD